MHFIRHDFTGATPDKQLRAAMSHPGVGVFDRRRDDAEVEAVLEGLTVREPLSAEQVLAAGRLRRRTRSLGLSLGDRCCLALAKAHDAAVVTEDRPCKQLKGFRFEFVRGSRPPREAAP